MAALAPPIQIRRATLADCDIIAAFNIHLARETEAKSLDPAVVRAGVAAVLENAARGIYYLAEIQTQVVGQLMITWEWSDWRNGNFWWIQSVYVATTFRGRGVFRHLMQQVSAEAASEPGCVGLRLYVHRQNHIALQTYQTLGFSELDYQILEFGGKYPRE
jgi:ribosomal protein S18 acetylase RimI-like enzyme